MYAQNTFFFNLSDYYFTVFLYLFSACERNFSGTIHEASIDSQSKSYCWPSREGLIKELIKTKLLI